MCALPIKRWRFSLALPAALAAAAVAAAEPLPIHIAANRAVVSQRSEESRYFGDVEVTQGALVLRGEELTIRRGEGGAIEALLLGNPVTIKRPASQEYPQAISGHARQLSYSGAEQVVELSGDAYLKRGGNAVRGKTIRHDLDSGRTEATSGDNQRVRITIQPETIPENDHQSPGPPAAGKSGDDP